MKETCLRVVSVRLVGVESVAPGVESEVRSEVGFTTLRVWYTRILRSHCVSFKSYEFMFWGSNLGGSTGDST